MTRPAEGVRTVSCPVLIGDGIENAWNAQAMQHAAEMFGWGSAFRDREGLLDDWTAKALGPPPACLSLAEIREQCDSIVAFDNGEGALPLYGFRPGRSDHLALAVGNERRGLAGDLVREARHLVHVPMASRRVNCLNVAASAAVALFYLSKGGGGKLYTRADPHRNRPELLLVGGEDHVDLGSTIRSAAAFGWKRTFIEDREKIWFGCDRVVRSQGRAAARRGKNTIRLVPTRQDRRYAFEEACIVTVPRRGTSASLQPGGRPLSRANLAKGPRQVIVLADEGSVDAVSEDWKRLARTVQMVTIDLPAVGPDFVYHYRLASTIALAEVARQVGIRAPKVRGRRRPPVYDRSLRTLVEETGDVVLLADLAEF